MHESRNVNATSPVSIHDTYAVAIPMWRSRSPIDWWISVSWPFSNCGASSGCQPNAIPPAASATSTTVSTAAHDSSVATKSFAASNRTLPTGRIRMKRRFPHDASLAIASPPKIATMMMSRNALISASAAAGITRPEIPAT